MSVKQLNSEYPEHLNPFRSRSSGISKSFRGFTRAIVKSFRGKDKEKPVIRPKPVEQVTYHHLEPPVAFPRSRFSERLSKTDALRQITNSRQSLPNTLGDNNPFDESNEQNKTENNVVLPPKPMQRSKLKRKKKRAPIPPEAMTIDGYLSASVNGSKWSLTSTESDMSSMYYSESEIDNRIEINRENENNNPEETEEILKITREIAQFTAEDTNNNILNNVKEPSHEETEVPKIVIESPPIDKIDLEIKNSKEENNNIGDNMPDVIKILNESDTHQNSNNREEIVQQTPIKDENEEKPSIKIEKLEDVEVRLKETDDDIEKRHSVKQTIEFFEYSNQQPDSSTPKVRKNILTKENLLGAELK